MESIGPDLRQMQRTPLTPDHVAALRAAGREETFAAGTFLARPGEPADRLVYVEDGEIEVVNPVTGERHLPTTLGPGQYMGEIALLSGGNWSMAMRAARPTRAIVVPRAALLATMADVPEMSDIVITVLAARRRRQLDERDGNLTLIGDDGDRELRRIAEFASRNRIPHVALALDSDAARDLAAACGLEPGVPAVVFGPERVLPRPTLRQVAALLGVSQDLAGEPDFDLLIVGGGPAGVAAAVYAGAEGISALLLEDLAVGGQAGTSSRIENYMGFPTGISGADLVWRGEVQALKFGTRFALPRRVERLEALDGGFCATLDTRERVRARAVVVATGVQYRRLPIPRLADFEGAGVYYAATEMEARFCAGTEAVIIGGGNSAGQAAMYLSRTAHAVRLVVRGDSLAASMSHYLSSRLEADPRITIEYRAEVTALHGDAHLAAVTLRDRASGTTREIPTRALFVMVGAAPNTGWLAGLADLDAGGFVRTGAAAGAAGPYATSCPGVFAVGDVRAGSVKRVASAVGEGSVVISHVWQHLNAGGMA